MEGGLGARLWVCLLMQEMQETFPGWGRAPGGGNDNPLLGSLILLYFCLENSMDRGASRVEFTVSQRVRRVRY